MELITYVATIRHDDGEFKIRVVSLSGRKGAIQQITTAEKCPECAIVKLEKKHVKKIR